MFIILSWAITCEWKTIFITYRLMMTIPKQILLSVCLGLIQTDSGISSSLLNHPFLTGAIIDDSDIDVVTVSEPIQDAKRLRNNFHSTVPLLVTAFGNNYNLQLIHNEILFSTYGDYSLPVLVSEATENDTLWLIHWKQHNTRFLQDVENMASFAATFMDGDQIKLEGIIHGSSHDVIILPLDGFSYVHSNRSNRLSNLRHVAVRRRHASTDIAKSIEVYRNAHLSSDVASVINGRVEIFIWTDYSFYESFNSSFGQRSNEDLDRDMLRYVSILANAADLLYRRAITDPTLKIRLSLTGVRLSKSRNCSQFTEKIRDNNSVNNHKALDNFAADLKLSYNLHRFSFRFDHATALTRLLLTDPVTNPIGVSYTDKICSLTDGQSSSLVRDQGGFSSVATLVHEIAHTLGSDHDGWGRSTGCRAADGYIMSPLNSFTKNSFSFSHCSVDSIKINLRKSSSSCIFDTPHPIAQYAELTTVYPGQLLNRSEQCRQIYGTEFCLSFNTKLEDICTKMWCWDPAKPNYCLTKMHAALGTSCGTKQWCIGGECVYDVRAP